MKVLLTTVLLTFLSVSAFCQSNFNLNNTEPTIEELRREILQMKEETREMQFHLHKSHKEFRTGTILYAVGFGLLAIAGGSGSYESAGALGLLGSGCLLTGLILHVDSHKHIDRAGFFGIKGRK